MKVEQLRFKDVAIGEAFMFGSAAFIKLDRYVASGGCSYNCVLLARGEPNFFGDHVSVVPCPNAKVTL